MHNIHYSIHENFQTRKPSFKEMKERRKKSKTMSMSIRFIINLFMAFSCIYWTAVSLAFFFFICNEFAIKELLKILSSECSQCNNFISYRQLTWIHNAMLLWCFSLPSNKNHFKVLFFVKKNQSLINVQALNYSYQHFIT